MDNDLKWILGNNPLNKAYFNSTQVYPVNENVTVNVTGVSEGFEITLQDVITDQDNNAYIPLEYIESTGSQYIDTGFKINQDTRVVMKVKATSISDNAWAFEGRISYSSASKGVFFYYSNNKLWNVDYNGDTNRKSISGVAATDMLDIDYDKNVCTINGVSVTHTADTFQSSCNLTLLAANTADTITGYLKAKLYLCQIYDNGTLVRDFVPVKRSDGVAGLYDKVNKEFYASASSTALVAGAESSTIYITQTTTSAVHKIPFGTKYMISASEVNGFVTPESLSYVANMKNRNVTLTYVAHSGTTNPSNGVYIQDTDGYFHTEAEWDGTYTADCVAVITSSCRFGIALTEASSVMRIYHDNSAALENYMTAISDETQAKADYNGAKNTTYIMWLSSSTSYAAGWCNAYIFPSGKNGYLPSLGQMWAAYNNKSAIDEALTKAGGTALSSTSYWTSTFWGANIEFDRRLCWLLYWSYGSVNYNFLDNNHQVRAFAAI